MMSKVAHVGSCISNFLIYLAFGAFKTSFALTESGDSILMLAIIDRLEEIKEIKCIYYGESTQNNVYIKG